MSIFKRHFFTTLAAMIVAAACGTLAGYQLARYIAVRSTERQLDRYASRILAGEETTSVGLRSVLSLVDASRYRKCSNAEIDYFRTLILASEYLKDVGHMRNGKIECSAALARPAQPGRLSVPDFIQQDGAILYENQAPYRNNGLPTITLQLGDSFAVFTPSTGVPLEPSPMHFTETATNAKTRTYGRLFGEPLQANASILTSEGATRLGDNLYASRCSTRFSNCVTAFTSIPEIVQANRAKFIGLIALFRLSGGLAGLAGSLLYYRSKSVEQQLRRAIRRDELYLVYQPIMQLPDRRLVGAEALLRWTDKQGLSVGPGTFIRIAEEQGFVGAITRLVVRHALRDFGEILRSHPGFRLSINAAAEDLADPSFLPMLNCSLDQAAIPARSLAIEMTEGSTVMRKASIDTIRALRERGHSVYIDDFGTGYSSLSYLHDLSVDAIKIDKAFTQAIGTGSVVVAILPQILAMAGALNLQVVAEGIETEEQAGFFASAAPPVLAQGWLFGRPVPVGEFRGLLAEDEKNALAITNADTLQSS
jgi:sensor c-di-GMP phosphodiesterase-like protein